MGPNIISHALVWMYFNVNENSRMLRHNVGRSMGPVVAWGLQVIRISIGARGEVDLDPHHTNRTLYPHPWEAVSLLSNSSSVWDSLVLTNVAPAYFITASTSTHKGWMTLAGGYSGRLQALALWQMTLFILLDFIPLLFSSLRDIKIPLCFRNTRTRRRSNKPAAKWEGSEASGLYFSDACQWQTPTQSQKREVRWAEIEAGRMGLTHFGNRSWRTLTPHY